MSAYAQGRLGPLLTLLLLFNVAACRREEGSGFEKGSLEVPPSEATETSAFREDEPGILLVWVAQDGDFHTSTKVADVPPASRQRVRILFEKRTSGSAEHVLVSNLNERSGDGSFRLRRVPRQEWETLGLAQRQARLPTPPAQEKPVDGEPATLNVDATIYGASWCKPCHLAEDYLKKRGARVVKKDIEEDPKAAAEMHQVLRGAGLSGASIPVLNVGGTVLVGFSTSAIDAALRRATTAH